MCTSFKVEALNGIHAFGVSVVRGATTADTFKAALYVATGTQGAGTTAYSATNEVSGTGYTAGGVTLTWIALVGAEGQGRWPWVGFVLLAAVPFLLLPVPEITARLRTTFAGRTGRVIVAAAALAAYGVVLSSASGASRLIYILLWPVCIAAAVLAVGAGREGEPSPVRLLLTGLPIWILAGVWDSQLQTRVPGTIDIGLPYLAALDLALFLLLVVRPLRSFDMGLGLGWRDVATALAAVGALLLVALPVGYLVGFLRFNARWNGLEYAAGRLIGLVRGFCNFIDIDHLVKAAAGHIDSIGLANFCRHSLAPRWTVFGIQRGVGALPHICPTIVQRDQRISGWARDQHMHVLSQWQRAAFILQQRDGLTRRLQADLAESAWRPKILDKQVYQSIWLKQHNLSWCPVNQDILHHSRQRATDWDRLSTSALGLGPKSSSVSAT